MSRKFYFSFLAFALTLIVTVVFVVGHSTGTRAASGNAALSALPASDFVISIDAQRALNETLPTILAANPGLLAKMNAELDEFQRKTGINPRTVESIAIGGRFKDPKPRGAGAVLVVRGSFRSDELLENAIATAKARGEKFEKEETQYEGKRIFLISHSRVTKVEVDKSLPPPPAVSVDPAPSTDSSGQVKVFGYSKGSRRDQMAVAVLDDNTLAVGTLDSVRAAIDASLGRNRVDDELVRLATQNPNAIIGFSGKVPEGLAEKNTGTPHSIENYFASIRQFHGSFNADGTDAEGVVALRTETSEQASEISQALNAMKALSAFGFAQSSGGNAAKKDSLADLLNGLSITTQGNEVQINVRIPQASIAPLVRELK